MPRPPEIPLYRATTLSLRVPRVDWAAVSAGTKTQFRACGRGAPQFSRVKLPRPVVLHSKPVFTQERMTRLGVLEDVYREPLGAITPEGLAAEGIESLAEFRRYWILRNPTGGFKPLTLVHVYCISLWQDSDRERFGGVLIDHLYGPWL